RNITCEVTDVSATCVIAQLGTQPAPVDGCDGTVGYKVVLGADGSVEQPCVPAAEQPQPAPGDTAILDYGTSKTVGPFTCGGTAATRAVRAADGTVEQPCVPAAEQPRPAPGDTAILDDGTSKTVGPFTCDSAETGMTCRETATGKGFTIARAGIRTL